MTINKDTALSRRSLLRGSSVLGGGLLLAVNLPRPLAMAAMENATPVVFNPSQWVTVEALTGRIIPTDHQPGAIEANCVNFIDKTLANEDAQSRPDFMAGLVSLNSVCRKKLSKPFIELSVDQQDRVLSELEADTAVAWPNTGPAGSVFFELLRALTIMGFMADPKYGGNADLTGWRVARYPGPRHHQGGYTPAQMLGEEEIITLWGDKM
ncbi:MAG: gluconate 2-dehydrogenase subunit 3 family protein [Halioglobus sp.]